MVPVVISKSPRSFDKLEQASDGWHTDVDVRLVTGEGSSVVPDLASAPGLLHGVYAPLVAESAARGAHESAREGRHGWGGVWAN